MRKYNIVLQQSKYKKPPKGGFKCDRRGYSYE